MIKSKKNSSSYSLSIDEEEKREGRADDLFTAEIKDDVAK